MTNTVWRNRTVTAAAIETQVSFSRRCLFWGCKIYRLQLSIPEVPAALNTTLNLSRWGRRDKNRSWDARIAYDVHFIKPRVPLERAKITLVRHSYRMLDFDGVVGSMKPVVDALVTAGVLADDSWRITGPWIVDQKFRPKKDGPLLEILIEEV
jgi:hypothetical protein